jgi:hypothetical protein
MSRFSLSQKYKRHGVTTGTRCSCSQDLDPTSNPILRSKTWRIANDQLWCHTVFYKIYLGSFHAARLAHLSSHTHALSLCFLTSKSASTTARSRRLSSIALFAAFQKESWTVTIHCTTLQPPSPKIKQKYRMMSV